MKRPMIFIRCCILSAAAALLVACAGERRQLAKPLPEPRTDAILSLASLAPSGHNTQPWVVSVRPDQSWIVGWDRTRALTAVDPGNRELMLSLGAFCEAARTAAPAYGLRAEIHALARSNFDEETAVITFAPADRDDSRIGALTHRRTVRKGLLSHMLAPAGKNALASSVRCRFHFVDRGTGEARLIEKAVLESNIRQADRKDAVEELSRWIRWKDADVRMFGNGLTPEGMEITGFAGFFVRHFFSAEDVKKESFRDATISSVKDALAAYGGWILLETDDSSPSTRLETGGDFLRLSLAAYDHRIALHPMTQPLEEKGFADELKQKLGIRGQIQFILRAGHVEKYPDPVTVRMKPSYFRK